jgi:hypothetical protein
MHFGENQLSPLSIGISPLRTRHPSGLQSTPVRASTSCYGRFTLRIRSSSGFGSTSCDRRPVQTRFRCGSGCHCLNRPQKVTRRIMLQKARRQASLRTGPSTACKQPVSGSLSLPSPGYFSPFPHGTVRYRSLHVVRLGEWAPQFHTGLLVSGATQVSVACFPSPPTGLSPSLARCSKPLRLTTLRKCVLHHATLILQPHVRNGVHLGTYVVWTRPGSLAATTGLLPFPRATEMFQFTRCPSSLRSMPATQAGCPIRRSLGHSLGAAHQRLSQRSHVLHRHAAPRHPPVAPCVFPDGTSGLWLGVKKTHSYETAGCLGAEPGQRCTHREPRQRLHP